MTQEEKQLLLRDLCARLPYGVKIKFAFNKDVEKINNLIYVSDDEQSYIHNSCLILTEDNIKYVFNDWLDECKPYLRPMSSMTEEEIEIYRIIIKSLLENSVTNNVATLYNFLNSKHLDYNSLIYFGLAIEVTEENNPYK